MSAKKYQELFCVNCEQTINAVEDEAARDRTVSKTYHELHECTGSNERLEQITNSVTTNSDRALSRGLFRNNLYPESTIDHTAVGEDEMDDETLSALAPKPLTTLLTHEQRRRQSKPLKRLLRPTYPYALAWVPGIPYYYSDIIGKKLKKTCDVAVQTESIPVTVDVRTIERSSTANSVEISNS
ncbi:hypothetical protein K501DRAFT_276008 [Backusella circina FSU 941]|nr:hypothetical protein K501DRAFT_276008 [Backusella circina FSU 941]